MEPGQRPQQARDGFGQRRLAGAVGTQQRDDLAALEREVDILQHAMMAVADRERFELKQRHGPTPSSPEIGFDHAAIALHLRWRAGRDDRAGIEHDDAVGDIHHQRHVVLDDKHGDAELSDRAQQICQPLGLGVVEAGRGLVET